MKVAWVIEWEDIYSPLSRARPVFLPGRWHCDRVFEIMRCLYWNSPIVNPNAVLAGLETKNPIGLFIKNDGPLLEYGGTTHLVGSHVRDLSFEHLNDGKILIQWTRPARQQVNPNTHRPEPCGPTVKGEFLFVPDL